jgi:putative transposase
MPRSPRIDVEGALHHVYDRGNRRQVICEDDLDYRFFLALVERAVRRFEWRVHAYCVMPNHYHLLIESEAHAIWVNRYIARNPVEAGLAAGPKEWAWSSYGALRKGAAPSWLAHDAVLRLFGAGEAAAVAYERLILDENGPDPPGDVQGLTPDAPKRDVAQWNGRGPTGRRSRRRRSRPSGSAARSGGP